MKYFLSLIVTISILCTSLSAVEYGMLSLRSDSFPDTITLNDGDIFEIVGIFQEKSENSYILGYEEGTDTTQNEVAISSEKIFEELIVELTNNSIITGPLELLIRSTYNGTSGDFTVSYKLTRASELEYKNVNIISLPSSAVGAGTHEIVVEASDDLQSWTPVHSSSIGGNKTFFRTRVTEIGN